MEVIANEGLECLGMMMLQMCSRLGRKEFVPLEDSFIIAQLSLFVRKSERNIFIFFAKKKSA